MFDYSKTMNELWIDRRQEEWQNLEVEVRYGDDRDLEI